MKFDDENEERGFIGRHRIVIGIAGAILVTALAVKMIPRDSQVAAQQTSPRMVIIQPVSNVTPTPLPVQRKEPVQDKKIEAPFVAIDTPATPAKPSGPPPSVATAITGPGPGDFSIGSTGPGNGDGVGDNGIGSGNARWNAYAALVKGKIEDSLRSNKATKTARFEVEILVWPDSTGLITKAKLRTSTGEASTDEAIQRAILGGLRTNQPPPTDLRTPIVMKISALRTE